MLFYFLLLAIFTILMHHFAVLLTKQESLFSKEFLKTNIEWVKFEGLINQGYVVMSLVLLLSFFGVISLVCGLILGTYIYFA